MEAVVVVTEPWTCVKILWKAETKDNQGFFFQCHVVFFWFQNQTAVPLHAFLGKCLMHIISHHPVDCVMEILKHFCLCD